MDSEATNNFEDVLPWVVSTNATTSSLNKSRTLKAIVGTVCVLSIIGSVLIIMSYLCFKKRRTKAREILVHISLMDMGVSIANLVGIAADFDDWYYYNYYSKGVPDYIEGLCKTQAFFAGYFTLGSVFWTISLMAYLYFRILHSEMNYAQYFLNFCYGLCYGFPLFILLWLVLAGHLGYSPYDSSGWCSLISKDTIHGRDIPLNLYIAFFGSDLWMYLAIFLIPILYISVRLFIYSQVNVTRKYKSEKQLWSTLHKFLLIPIIFVSLRIWGIIDTWILLANYDLPKDWATVFYYLTGIGDSGQGFANALLFVIFSKSVRQSFKRCLKCQKELPTSDTEERLIGEVKEEPDEGKMLEPSASSDYEPSTAYTISGPKTESSHFNAPYGTINY